MRLSEKIKTLRAEKGWTQEDLAKFSGVSLGSIKRYETDNGNITYSNLEKIANAFGISVSKFYDENLSISMSISNSENCPLDVHKSKNLSPNMSPNIKKSVSQYVSQSKNFSPNVSNSQNLPKKADEIVKIPYFQDTYASAGTGAINYDEMPVIMELDINFIRVFLQITSSLKNMHIINAKGDSMEPTIKDGELLYINPIENEGGVNSGSIYVINLNGDILVKRIDKNPITKALTLISDNSKYKPIEIKNVDLELCSVIGRVVAHTARL